MPTDFLLPDLGEDIDEADVTKVYVSEGDPLTLEQAIIEIETEKATLDVPSSVVGTVTSVRVSLGDTIHPGQIILTFSETVATGQAPAVEPEVQATTPTPTPKPEPAPTAPPASAEAEPAAPPQPVAAEAPAPAAASSPTGAFAAPSVRKFAREVGIDVQLVEGSGPGGRISDADVKRFARESRSGGPSEKAAPELPDFARFGPIERRKLTRLRRTVARNMATSWEQVPRVALQHTADVTDLEEFRQRQKARAAEAGGSLTMTAILVKIVAAALRAHPHVNASLDTANNDLIVKRYYHIGVAVDTDRGLVVPVIRDVDRKNIVELGVELSDLSQRARDNKLTLDEMRGGTFTVTNLGGLGTGFFSAVLNWPEVGILAVGRAEQTPVYQDGELVPRLRMPLTLAFDHRAFDGADAARFMSWVVNAINQPLLLALEG